MNLTQKSIKSTCSNGDLVINFKNLQSRLNFASLPSSSSNSLQPLTDYSESTKSISNPLHNFLPKTQNPQNTVSLICSALKNRNNDQLALLQKTIQNNGLISHFSNNEISRVLLRCQSDSSSALSFFNWVKTDLGLKPNTQNYCLVIHILTWSKNFSQAMKILSELVDLKRNGVENVDVFDSLVSSSGLCNWDPVVFDMLIKAFLKVNMVKDGYRVFRKTVKHGIYPSVIAINCLLTGLSKLNYSKKCWEVYGEMERIGVHPNSCTFNILTHVLCKDEDVNKVNDFLEKMEEEGFQPDMVTYNTLVSSYCRKGRMKDAVYLYQIMYIRGVSPDLFTYTSLINGFCKKGNVKDAHQLFVRMSDRGLKPDVILYNTLICGYCKEGMMQEARFLLHDMIGEGMYPDKFTCSVLVQGYQKQDNLVSAVNLVTELQRFRFVVSRDIYNYLISALCMENRPFAAKALIDRVSYEPDNMVYRELIESFCRCNCPDEALSLKAEMVSKDLKPDIGTYRAIIKCLCKSGRSMDANSLMREMTDYDVPPDIEVCRALINGHCGENNFREAQSLLSFFGREFKIFDTVCYNAIVRLLSAEGDIVKLMQFQDKMRKVGFAPNQLTCKYVIDGLQKAVRVHQINI
ncbi:pentatricopeptide repeat-containing protein At5g40400 isoform X1 [Lycium ferocissimum]|uniref:pentatricopeptide repeat-containing protein At5g40400 isoform X1 n=1 Tax=Lycium ferocissimum TaxID=112874 RepID=UPI002815FDBE|nr:pentatricopeptide repeat-containing protein At5g40400 isoform X1 [Lycium ferocissimum]XP_059304670.1 pentatricopeptide repeat-containing protein At5g40400 isoform X1 [Lycium ferocissimum]